MQNIKELLARRQITRPRSVIITSRYFWRKWRPILGNSLALLIIEARQKCYRNLNTGEVRNWFYSTMKELGQTAGFSPKKISGLLRKPHADKFIQYQPTYIFKPELGKKIKGKCLFRISLDDPLIPEDSIRAIADEVTGQNIYKDESFQKQPNGQNVSNRYSTLK